MPEEAAERVVQDRELLAGRLQPAADDEQGQEEEEDQAHGVRVATRRKQAYFLGVHLRRLTPSLAAAAAILLAVTACGGRSPAPASVGESAPETAPASLRATPTMPPPLRAVTLLAVGDTGSCDGTADEAVAALAAELAATTDATVALLGDIAYPDGSSADFAACFDPAWQPLFGRLRPAPGNHEYQTDGAAGYFAEFAALPIGDPGAGWYAYRLGEWTILALNSNCDAAGGCGPGSAQYRWLADQLAADDGRCTLAYWHHPRYSSGRHGSDPMTGPLWDLLADANAEVVLSGHDHTYERLAPIDGIRQFVVGVGGRSLYSFEGDPLPQTEARADDTYGLLQLSLEPDGYAWRFVPATAAGGSFTDVGDAACH